MKKYQKAFNPLPKLSDVLKNLPFDFNQCEPGQKSWCDKPIWHNDSAAEDTQLMSGELRCELTALTPLLIGNHRYEAQQVPHVKTSRIENIKKGKHWQEKRIPLVKLDSNVADGTFSQLPPVAPDKSIVEPLKAPDGRVLLSGASIKGAIKNSLKSLLNAPMTKVKENWFGFRPNLGALGTGEIGLTCLPAVVHNYQNDELDVRLITNGHILFLKSENKILAKLFDNQPPHEKSFSSAELSHFYVDANKYKASLVCWRTKKVKNGDIPLPSASKWLEDKGLKSITLMPYNGGIVPGYDQNPKVPQNDRLSKVQCHQWAFVAEQESTIYRVKKEVLDWFNTSQNLKTNNKSGHFASGYPKSVDHGLIQKQINANPLNAGQLIYVEMDTTGDVVSLGQQYHYLLSYQDSTTQFYNGEHSVLRPQMRNLPHETPVDKDNAGDAPPSALSIGNLLFGYSDERIGNRNFSRLAGRISPNFALEVLSPGTSGSDTTRFLNQGKAIPLKILGQPKASAAEYYLEQEEAAGTGNIAITDYNSTAYPMLDKQKPKGNIRGYKYYPHQPAVNENPQHYAYDSDSNSHLSEIESNQSSLALQVSKTGTVFRFTCRFHKLRRQELALLILALQPELSELLTDSNSNSQYALKLGMARPLGWGSVKCSIKSMCYIDNEFDHSQVSQILPFTESETEAEKNKLVELLKPLVCNSFTGDKEVQHTQHIIAKNSLEKWQQRHRFEDAKYGLPRQYQAFSPDPNKQATIFGFHMALRKHQLRARKKNGNTG